MIKAIKKLFSRIPKLDFAFIFILLVVTLATRILLISKAPFVYAEDAYMYLGEARDFAYHGIIDLSPRLPFVVLLGFSLRILGPIFGDFSAAQVFVSISGVLLIEAIYFLGMKMSGRLFGFLAGLLAIFEPISLKYSIVPYTDIFAMAMALLGFCFLVSYRGRCIFLSLLLSYVAILTRPELFFAIAVPTLVFYLCKSLKHNPSPLPRGGIKGLGVFLFVAYILPVILLYQYVQSQSIFSISVRFALFFKPDLLATTLDSAFQFYDTESINRIMILFVILVLAFSFFTAFVKITSKKIGNNFVLSITKRTTQFKVALLNDSAIIAFVLFLFFVIQIAVLTLWAYGYSWAFYVPSSELNNLAILSPAVIINPPLLDRYMIPLRMLISFPFAYPLAMVMRKIATYIREK